MYHAKNNAAFINVIAEEGTKAETLEWLQRVYDNLCEAETKLRGYEQEAGRSHICAVPHERRGCAFCERDLAQSKLDAVRSLALGWAKGEAHEALIFAGTEILKTMQEPPK